MKYLKTFLVLIILFFAAPAVNAADSFTFSGNGLGHGVGLSQIGAKAMALNGSSAEDILKYYYTGVTIEPVIDWYDLRVNIGHQLNSATLQMVSKNGTLQINDYQITDNLSSASFKYSPDGIVTTITKNKKIIATLPALPAINVQWSGTRFMDGAPTVISMNTGKYVRYQFGEINLLVVGKSFEVTNSVRLKDEYLYGISEVSSAWPIESLKAQVIAARTYALAKSIDYRPSCDCDIYGTVQDQLFVGIGKLSEAKYGALWKAAVDSTNIDDVLGLAITYKGEPISAYYSSSSGGNTESALNAFGTAQDYLQSVADPASLDPKLNPNYASWTRVVSSSLIAKAFAIPDIQSLVINGKRIEATSNSGSKVSLRLETFRSRVALPSATFKIN